MRVGIIGVGVVGGAIKAYLDTRASMEVCTYDIRTEGATIEAVLSSDVCFVCVPVATLENGALDFTQLNNTLRLLSINKYQGNVVIKSTVLPGTCAKIQFQFPGLTIVHNPEFLRESSAAADFARQRAALVSGPNAVATLRLYKDLCIGVEYSPNYADTELAKYIHNCFLAMKVIFMNEITGYQEKTGMFTHASRAAHLAATQGCIGQSHLEVPGPDGQLGYGGMCFPKDMKAFIVHARRYSSQFLLETAHNINTALRGTHEKDSIHLQEK